MSPEIPPTIDLPNVAFIGKAGAGKTTGADFLAAEFGYMRASFAKPLKDVAAQIWGESARTDRAKLQGLGVCVCVCKNVVRLACSQRCAARGAFHPFHRIHPGPPHVTYLRPAQVCPNLLHLAERVHVILPGLLAEAIPLLIAGAKHVVGVVVRRAGSGPVPAAQRLAQVLPLFEPVVVQLRYVLLHDGQRPMVAEAFRRCPLHLRLRNKHGRNACGAFHDVDDGLKMFRLEVLVCIPPLLGVAIEARVCPHPHLIVLVHDVVRRRVRFVRQRLRIPNVRLGLLYVADTMVSYSGSARTSHTGMFSFFFFTGGTVNDCFTLSIVTSCVLTNASLFP